MNIEMISVSQVEPVVSLSAYTYCASNSGDFMMDLEFKDVHLSYHHEQNDFRLYAYCEGNAVGHIDYSTFEGDVNVSFINSYILRKGIGTAMLKELQDKYPRTAIKFGYLTDEGNLLLDSLTWNVERNDLFDGLEKAKSRLRSRLNEIDTLWKRLDTINEHEKTETLALIESLCWNETSDALEKVELRLSREPESFRYIDTGSDQHKPTATAAKP
jgi:hypothetical protein